MVLQQLWAPAAALEALALLHLAMGGAILQLQPRQERLRQRQLQMLDSSRMRLFAVVPEAWQQAQQLRSQLLVCFHFHRFQFHHFRFDRQLPDVATK